MTVDLGRVGQSQVCGRQSSPARKINFGGCSVIIERGGESEALRSAHLDGEFQRLAFNFGGEIRVEPAKAQRDQRDHYYRVARAAEALEKTRISPADKEARGDQSDGESGDTSEKGDGDHRVAGISPRSWKCGTSPRIAP